MYICSPDGTLLVLLTSTEGIIDPFYVISNFLWHTVIPVLYIVQLIELFQFYELICFSGFVHCVHLMELFWFFWPPLKVSLTLFMSFQIFCGTRTFQIFVGLLVISNFAKEMTTFLHSLKTLTSEKWAELNHYFRIILIHYCLKNKMCTHCTMDKAHISSTFLFV